MTSEWVFFGIAYALCLAEFCAILHFQGKARQVSALVDRDRFIRRMQAADIRQLSAEVAALNGLVQHLKAKCN